MKEARKDFCMERLNAIIENMKTSETEGSKFYFLTKSEGFLEGLFYADIIDDKEYSEIGEMISELYFQ